MNEIIKVAIVSVAFMLTVTGSISIWTKKEYDLGKLEYDLRLRICK